jgi:hypothetical protein
MTVAVLSLLIAPAALFAITFGTAWLDDGLSARHPRSEPLDADTRRSEASAAGPHRGR